jgi:hypothetical protein
LLLGILIKDQENYPFANTYIVIIDRILILPPTLVNMSSGCFILRLRKKLIMLLLSNALSLVMIHSVKMDIYLGCDFRVIYSKLPNGVA